MDKPVLQTLRKLLDLREYVTLEQLAYFTGQSPRNVLDIVHRNRELLHICSDTRNIVGEYVHWYSKRYAFESGKVWKEVAAKTPSGSEPSEALVVYIESLDESTAAALNPFVFGVKDLRIKSELKALPLYRKTPEILSLLEKKGLVREQDFVPDDSSWQEGVPGVSRNKLDSIVEDALDRIEAMTSEERLAFLREQRERFGGRPPEEWPGDYIVFGGFEWSET